MRITESIRMSGLSDANAESALRLHMATRRASTGERVSAPGDDPGAFAQIARYEGAAATYEARRSALEKAQDAVAFAESALASAADIMSRARELAVQMADGTVAPEQRDLAAKEVTQLRQALVGIGNSRTASGYVFGGSKTDAPPFSTNGVFNGNDDALEVEIAEGQRIRANASGARAFTGAGGRDLFQDLASFATALQNNDIAGVQAMASTLDEGIAQITGVRGESGLAIDSVRMAASAARLGHGAVESARAGVQEVDVVQAYSDLSSAQGAYERSLEITRKILSLMPADKVLAR
ncbi:MAG: flagellar hook-associated protein FlgL [Myxococcales bacterium]|nr:flagellar hook-associated protein FlgL [Myxococcales bacterium]